MKKIQIQKIEIRNFKATASQIIDLAPSGIIIAGHNGSGKSSILEAVMFCLGASCEAQRVINQTTKAPASVSLTIEHPEGVDTYTRTLIPNLDASGKITASTSSYVISGVPHKKTEYDIRINQLFGTKDWIYLLNPSLAMQNKSNRNLLLAVAGCPSEKEFLQEHNQQLANIIGNTSFDDFEKREKATIQALGKKIDSIPAKIEELSAMLQEVPELEDEAPIHQRIAEIREVLKGVDAENTSRADQYNKVACEAQSLRNEAQKLRNLAAEKISLANKTANKMADEADALIADWNRTLFGLRRQADQIKAEMSEARQDQAMKEKQLADVNAEIQTLADRCKTVAGWKPKADGMCKQCNKFCPELQALGLTAAIEYQQKELDNTKSKGRATVAQRDKLQGDLDSIAKKIDSLMSQEHSIEASINALGVAPTAPERKVVESTEESRHLEQQAADLEATASKLIQSNRLDIAQKPTELIEELQQLNEKLTRRGIATTTQKNNDKINARISELREEESALITTQLQHKQHLAMLAQFHKDYANEVTCKCNDIFKDTEYSVILFSENMGNEKGSITFLGSKDGSTNLSHSENTMFWKLFVERVLGPHFGLACCPMILDDVEHIDSTEKLRSNHQLIAARVERHELEITNIE